MTAPAPIRKTDPHTRPEATGASTRARVGDKTVVRGTRDGVVAREGEIAGLQHPDGTPTYDVRWADDGRVRLYFPRTRRLCQASGTRTGNRRRP